MPYALPDDVRKVWHKTLTTNLTADEIAAFIDQAGHYIDGVLGRRYTVPFATTPDATPSLIRDITATLAMLEVIDRSPSTADWILRKIQRAEKLLELLADGTMVVPGADERTDLGGIQSSTAAYVPTFGASPSLTERVDPDRVDADEAERTP